MSIYFNKKYIAGRLTDKSKLIEGILKKVPNRYEANVLEAIKYAEEKHKGEKRFSGEDFIIHALNVAHYCAQINLDTTSIITALLHQVSSLSLKSKDDANKINMEIKDKFGEEIYNFIITLEQIKNATKLNHEIKTEVLKRFIISSTPDIRPIIIKICDILDDTRTIDHLGEDKKKDFCNKVLNVYAPLCEILNLNRIRVEISDTCFAIQKPLEAKYIKDSLRKRAISAHLLEQDIKYIKTITEILDYNAIVEGRRKSIYSIYKKFQKYFNEGTLPVLDEIKDTLAFRVITKTEEDCFKIADAIRQLTVEYPDKSDDYITNPKPNGYRAIQLIVKIPEISSNLLEIQILTHEMFYYNSYGPASHIAYKESQKRNEESTNAYNWVEDIHKAFDNHINLRETEMSIPISGEVFKNRVFVFTPQGHLIELPQGGTVLDFAFAVHSSIGLAATHGKINGLSVKLDQEVSTGDTIEIITQKGKSSQDPQCLNWVKTEMARKYLRKSL